MEVALGLGERVLEIELKLGGDTENTSDTFQSSGLDGPRIGTGCTLWVCLSLSRISRCSPWALR